jgi:cytochrome P450
MSEVAPVLDPYDYQFHEDPYPYYRRLRDEAPLYRNDDLNFWALTRHADVHAGFRNSTALSNKLGVSLDPISRTPEAYRTMSFLAMDDPAHLRLRSLVSKGFTPRRIRELEGRVLQLTREHLETALDSDSFDYITEFAGKLPMDVISELVGVPPEDRQRLRVLADTVMHREDGVTDVPQAALVALYIPNCCSRHPMRPMHTASGSLRQLRQHCRKGAGNDVPLMSGHDLHGIAICLYP